MLRVKTYNSGVFQSQGKNQFTNILPTIIIKYSLKAVEKQGKEAHLSFSSALPGSFYKTTDGTKPPVLIYLT